MTFGSSALLRRGGGWQTSDYPNVPSMTNTFYRVSSKAKGVVAPRKQAEWHFSEHSREQKTLFIYS